MSEAALATKPAKAEKPINIRLDRTKPYGTVHGDRTPNDPMHRVAFMQGGLPFDTEGRLIPDDGKKEPFTGVNADGEETTYHPLYTEAMRTALDKKKKRLKKAAEEAAAEIDAGEDMDEPADASEDVNIEAFLRGEIQYPFYLLSRAVQQRFHQKHNTLRPLIESLVLDEKVIPEDEVDKRLLRVLDGPEKRGRVRDSA